MGLVKGKTGRKYEQYKSKNSSIKCKRKIDDCMFRAVGELCSAEWCIFDELPKMLITKKTIKCVICGKSKTVSIFNAESNYICDNCIAKIKEKINE